MPDFNSVFKEEVRRLARKEIKDAAGDLKSDLVKTKKIVAGLRQEITELRRENKRMARILAKSEPSAPEPETVDRSRISSKMIRSLRSRLGLTQAEFAQLVGVSGQAVYQWEAKEGRLNLRSGPKARVIEARGMGVREARARLEGA